MSEEIKRNFATIGAVYEDGVTLIFDGEDDPTDKHYLCNTSVEFHAGDRVRIVECDGTYIVEYVVGPPSQGGGGGGLPPGGAQFAVLQKASAADGDATWSAVNWSMGGLPGGGTAGQVLTKNSGSTYDASWQNAPGGLPSGGSADYVLRKKSASAGDAEWVREAPAADAVVDQNTKTAYVQNKIYFRYYQNKFWARYNNGTWAQIN